MWNLKKFEEIYSRYQSSGLRIEEFCRNECIVRSKFYYWHRKLRKSTIHQRSESPGFVPVVFTSGGLSPQSANMLPRQPVPGIHPPGNEVYEIVYPDGVVLRVPRGTDLEQLRSLIQLIHQGHV